LPDVVALLRALPGRPDGLPEGERPYLEVCVALDRPEPGLRRQVEEALEGSAPRLVKLTAVHEGHGQSLAEAAAARDLKDLNPEEVFRSRYRRSHEGDPPPELLAAFHELVDQVGQEAGE
jgi:exonuclease SbcD